MRTPRIVILAAFFVASFTLIILSFLSPSTPSEVLAKDPKSKKTGVLGSFSFNAPLSLFPPNAIISLTDDNTTSFLARPAAFGPLLPSRGLSGQLWIGSGFGDDSLRQGIISTGAEGELGCSDVPGWPDGSKSVANPSDSSEKIAPGKAHSKKRSDSPSKAAISKDTTPGRADDGTDDYLHSPLSGASVAKNAIPGQPHENGVNSYPDHADIQSIQEGAEIAGKVVLLSRGGCGFMEKVKWAQRRGGIAVIVGDDTRGGPLIQMFARGDTSNVTIPSVFTSHTTAHLLSSLIPPGTYIEDTVDGNGNPMLKVQQPNKSKKNGKKSSKPTSSQKSLPPTSVPKGYTISSKKVAEPASGAKQERSWLTSLFSGSQPDSASKKGVMDWVLVDEWDENGDIKKPAPAKTAKGQKASKGSAKNKDASKSTTEDGFVIGVHDWRDPDLVEKPGTESYKPPKGAPKNSGNGYNKSPTEKGQALPAEIEGKKNDKKPTTMPKQNTKGGSITPGSGEYVDGVPPSNAQPKAPKKPNPVSTVTVTEKPGFITKIFGDDDDNDFDEPDAEDGDGDDGPDYNEGHEGLWVTLNQTNGATPFFDTLLVLVVSPLVTLTVVYALLLLRSRIRRRRWRAPKSVVERLPVRTYQTVASSSGSQSRQPTPTSSSPATPLLQQTITRPRPRSRTTSGLPEPGDLSRTNSSSLASPPRAEKHVTSEWKKYMGKQVECVVCLEEYVDGVSRVMSLPCGHEFHVDCM